MEGGRFSAEEIGRKNGFGNRGRMRRSFLSAFGHPAQAIQRTIAASSQSNPESHCRRHFHNCGWQSEMKHRASSIVGCGPQTATMRFHDGTTDRKPHAAALRFRGEEGIEDLVRSSGRQSYSGVAD
jgi:hypothetical protein